MRAREKILTAFRELVLTEHYSEIRTCDVIARAGVARSTFYACFRDKNHLLLESMGPILAVLADASSVTQSPASTAVLARSKVATGNIPAPFVHNRHG